MRTKMLSLVLASCSLAIPAVALAKGPMKNHHCMKDGTEMPDKTKKECKKEGGKWEKDAGEAKKADEPAK